MSLSSPSVLSSTSSSSFEITNDSSLSQSSVDSFSDEEILYSISDSEISTESSILLNSDDDYIVLSRPASRRQSVSTPKNHNVIVAALVAAPSPARFQEIVSGIDALSLESPYPADQILSVPAPVPPTISKCQVQDAALQAATRRASRRRCKQRRAAKKRLATSATNANPYPSPAATPAMKRKSCVATLKAPATKGLGERPVVDTDKTGVATWAYDEAVKYITSLLSNPGSEDCSGSNLTLLHALIVEFGLSSAPASPGSPHADLPSSLTTARALIKSKVFINIKDYLDIRTQGLDALQRAMHPSRKALVKSIRKKKKTAPLALVKDFGLNVLLVTPYH